MIATGFLKIGPQWRSFEELRSKHAENLEQIQDGLAGAVRVKHKTYYILGEKDLKRMAEVLQTIGTLAESLELLKTATQIAKERRDVVALKMLEQTMESATRAINETLIKCSVD